MFDNADVVFSEALRGAIRYTLYGDDKTRGLYQSLRNAQTWEAFQRACGVIEGYEQVLAHMLEISRRMNRDDAHVPSVPRMN